MRLASKFFAATIESTSGLLVPTITLYEVYKRMYQQCGEDFALKAIAAMRKGLVVDLTASLAVMSAMVSMSEGLPMADSVILATARAYDAALWTQDADFANVAGVRYVAKKLVN